MNAIKKNMKNNNIGEEGAFEDVIEIPFVDTDQAETGPNTAESPRPRRRSAVQAPSS